MPKLWVRGDPGFIANRRLAAFCEGLRHQTEVHVKGGQFLLESSGPEIGRPVADFVHGLRAWTPSGVPDQSKPFEETIMPLSADPFATVRTTSVCDSR